MHADRSTNPDHFAWLRFGSAAVRFIATKCANFLPGACAYAITVSVDENNNRALSILAPLCDRSTVEETLHRMAERLPDLMEAIKYLPVPPDLYAAIRKDKHRDLPDRVFDNIFEFNRTGVLPTTLDDYAPFAENVLEGGHLPWMERLVSALEETDAAGSLKMENIDRVVAWLDSFPDIGIIDFFAGCDEFESGDCVVADWLRPYVDIAARLFAIVPRPHTLEHKLAMMDTFIHGLQYEHVKEMYVPVVTEEAELLVEMVSYVCCGFDCLNKRRQRYLRLMGFADYAYSSLSDEGYKALAVSMLFDTHGNYDSTLQLLAQLMVTTEPQEPIVVDGFDDAFPTDDSQFTADFSEKLKSVLVHLVKDCCCLDVQRLIEALNRQLVFHSFGWTHALSIFVQLQNYGLLEDEEGSIPEIFFRYFAETVNDALAMDDVDLRAEISTVDFADFMMTLCQEHCNCLEFEDYWDDVKLRDILERLCDLQPLDFNACLEDCLRVAGKHNDTALVSILRQVSEGIKQGAL